MKKSCLKSFSCCNAQQKNWSMTCPVIWLLLTGTTGCWNKTPTGKLYYTQISRPLTDDASDVIPHRQAVGLSLLPAVVVAQIERKPEEEGVVDQLQTRVGHGILQCKKSTWCEQHSIQFIKICLVWPQGVDSQVSLRAGGKPGRNRWPEKTQPEVRPAVELNGVACCTPPPRPRRRLSAAGDFLCPSPPGKVRSRTPCSNLAHMGQKGLAFISSYCLPSTFLGNFRKIFLKGSLFCLPTSFGDVSRPKNTTTPPANCTTEVTRKAYCTQKRDVRDVRM